MAKSIRPAKCYKWDSPAYTRVSNNPSTSFITGIPGSKLIHFEMGNNTSDYDSTAQLVATENIIIRHNALESARMAVQKKLEKELGVTNYLFKINVFPHHIIRENVMATGAGADRVQDGMRKSYGKPMGRAARVHANQAVFTVKFNKTTPRVNTVRTTLNSAKKKLPGKFTLKLDLPKKSKSSSEEAKK